MAGRAKAILFFFLSLCAAAIFFQIQSPYPLMQVFGAGIGGIFIVVCIAYAYCAAGFHLQDNGLKILDWILLALNLSMMAAFQWLGVQEIVYWVVIVLLPSVVFRAIQVQYLKKVRSSNRPNIRHQEQHK